MKNKFMKMIFDDVRNSKLLCEDEIVFLWDCLDNLNDYMICSRVFDDSDVGDSTLIYETSCLSIRSSEGKELLSLEYLGDKIDKIDVNYVDLVSSYKKDDYIVFKKFIKDNNLVECNILPSVEDDRMYEVVYLLPNKEGKLCYRSHTELFYGFENETWEYMTDRYLAELFVKIKFYYKGEIDDLKIYNKLFTIDTGK